MANESTEYQRLVDVATEGFSRWRAAVDLPAVAAQAGLPVGRVMALFGDDEGLGVAVVEGQMRCLFDYIQREAAGAADQPLIQFRTVFQAYLTWMGENPVGARILLEPDAMRRFGDFVAARLAASIETLATDLLQRAANSGGLPAGVDVARTVLTARALARGLAYLQLSEPGGTDAEDNGDEVRRACSAALKAWLNSQLPRDGADD